MRIPATLQSRQQGFTLISMMVGLVISLITIAAMLALYKAMIDISGNASRTAQRDGQIASALLAAEIELQQAGFGLDVGEPGALAIVDDGTQLNWRYSAWPDAGYLCQGLRLATDVADARIALGPADAGADRRGLYLFPAKACTTADASLSWGSDAAERPRLLASSAAFFIPTERGGAALAETAHVPLAPARFTLESDPDCLPYAQQAGTASAHVAGSGELVSACLPNLGQRVNLLAGTGE